MFNKQVTSSNFEIKSDQDLIKCIQLANNFFNGQDGLEQNISKAIELYELAANHDYAPAISALANCYLSGVGVVQNVRYALELYKKAAEKNYPPAVAIMAAFYLSGNNDIIKQDIKQATILYTKAANSYLYGKGINKNQPLAIGFYRIAADYGYLPAMVELSNCYKDGIGVPQDEDYANELLKKAMNMGYHPSLTDSINTH